MLRPSRLPSPASESGVVAVGAVITVALGIFFIYLLLAAFQGDPAYYGSVPVPSVKAPIELSGGEVNVSYAEDIAVDAVPPVTPPGDLNWLITGADGNSLELDARSGDPEDSEAGAAQLIASVFVPDDGTYYVSAESSEAAGHPAPAIAFGQSPVGTVKERFDDVVDELKGPLGIIVLVVLVGLLLLPEAQRRMNRPESKDIYHQ